MHLFYTPDIDSDIYTLSAEESRHCQKVLRLQEGDTVHLTDGIGTLYTTRIIQAAGKQVTVEVAERKQEYGRRPYRLHMAVAPTKNIDRFEWFLEKATEIGVDEITPLLCEHSERKAVRTDRLEKVITSAVKQSLKAYHPVVHEMTSFFHFLSKKPDGQAFIAHLEEEGPVLLHSVCRRGSDVTILVGPEGDFSGIELDSAIKAGFRCVSLGESRLRTETAAVVATHAVCMLNLYDFPLPI